MLISGDISRYVGLKISLSAEKTSLVESEAYICRKHFKV